MSAYHVEVVLCVCPSQQIPYEDVPVVAGRQDDPGVKGVWLQDKHLSLMALKTMFRLVTGFKTKFVKVKLRSFDIHYALYFTMRITW